MHQSLHATAAETVSVSIVDGPLRSADPAHPIDSAGAIVCFEGIVRPLEDGREIVALDYEAYQPMAQTQLRRLAEEMVSRHGLLGVRVEHSRGRVRAGEVSFRLTIASRHRPEALRATEEFIDRMKRDVPIWKTPVYAE
jgi:molybdopterin synthase catalytic subunit